MRSLAHSGATKQARRKPFGSAAPTRASNNFRICRRDRPRAFSSRNHKQHARTSMIDHVGFPVSDYPRSKAFYERALAPLGYVLVMEVQQNEQDAKACGFGAGGKPDFWIGGEGGLNRPMHIAITAKDRAASMRFTKPRWRQAPRTTARQASARTITRTTTVPSCSIRTGTTSRRCVTHRRDDASRDNLSPHPEEPGEARRLEGWRSSMCGHPRDPAPTRAPSGRPP